jgi:hypothetical protein
MMLAAPIQGGYILLARKILKSGIMEKPQLYIKVWIWMLMQANFKDHGNLKRGQFFTSYRRICDALAYKAGYRTVKPTIDEIRSVTKFLTKQLMITTTKAIHGMVITILNYDFYQCFQNYEPRNESLDESHNDPTILRKKGRKKEKPLDLFSLKKRYAHPNLIDSVFQAIASTRKLGKVADSVLIAQLQKWAKYPVEQVESGIKIYLEKDYAAQGKREEYLLGIIRNNHDRQAGKAIPECRTPEWF